jgi:serine/threonine protein phosphatase PrpC
VPVRVHCPHCITPCQVADQHLGVPVQCYKCGEKFTARPVTTAALPKTDPSEEMLPGPPRLDIGHATTTGKVRKRNEDSFLVKHSAWFNLDQHHEIALLAVADGMGGYEAGDQASGMTIRSFGSSLSPLLDGALSGQFKDSKAPMLGETIDYAIQEANRSVFRKGKSDPACKGMGATLAVVLIWDDQVLIGHVGDTRVYHQHAGKLTQVTKDQTLVARMVELGKLTPAEALSHPNRNEVSQAVGKNFDITPAPYALKLARGDWLIVACDGLHAHVDDRTLQERIRKAGPSAAQLAYEMVELANQGGGSDNCTVIAVHCD